MRLLLLLTLAAYSALAQETTEKPLTETPPEVTTSKTTTPPAVTTNTTVTANSTTTPPPVTTNKSTITPLVTTVTPVESTTGHEGTTEMETTTGAAEEKTTKGQNGYGDEAVVPKGKGTGTTKMHGEKDTRVVPAKVANRHALFFSGYDKDRSARARRAAAKAKAQNGYGDEPITPAGYGGDNYEDEGTTTTSKAQNGYGDEPITPAGYGGDSYEDEGTTTTSTTTARSTTKKRQNGYGDEAIVPSMTDAPYAPQSEQEYAPVEPYAPPKPVVTEGGYKRIRRGIQNGYGDEAVTPADDGYGSAVTGGGQDEYAPATVAQSGYGEESVQKSGYNRRKRGNEYGDEQVTPSTKGKGSGYEPEPEQPYGVQGQEEATGVPKVTNSGY